MSMNQRVEEAARNLAQVIYNEWLEEDIADTIKVDGTEIEQSGTSLSQFAREQAEDLGIGVGQGEILEAALWVFVGDVAAKAYELR